MKKLKLEQDVETAIRLLRFLSEGQGFASISVIDTGAGGGFSSGRVDVNLERDGLLLHKEVYTVEELKSLVLAATQAHGNTLEWLNHYYKKERWNK